jgi:hypothetical protein
LSFKAWSLSDDFLRDRGWREFLPGGGGGNFATRDRDTVDFIEALYKLNFRTQKHRLRINHHGIVGTSPNKESGECEGEEFLLSSCAFHSIPLCFFMSKVGARNDWFK